MRIFTAVPTHSYPNASGGLQVALPGHLSMCGYEDIDMTTVVGLSAKEYRLEPSRK